MDLGRAREAVQAVAGRRGRMRADMRRAAPENGAVDDRGRESAWSWWAVLHLELYVTARAEKEEQKKISTRFWYEHS